MIINKIRLHPFAGTADRNFTFSEGLNVLSGENEFGKSTLFHALQEVLFTSTSLTPSVQQKWGNRWFPKPGGDHARVSLFFEAEGKSWQLEKVWGAGRQCQLREEGGNSLADPDRVAEKIRQLIKWNEATWTKVLFTRQAELARTIDELGDNLLGKIDDLETRLKGMAAIPGDIPAEQMKGILDDEIRRQNHRWEVVAERPQGGRGISEPWVDIVNYGATIRAFYEKEKAKVRLDSLRQQQAAIQSAREDKEKLEQLVKEDREFCITADAIASGLSQRGVLEGRLKELQLKEENARKDFQDWPVLNQEVKSMREVREKIQPEIDSLLAEQNIALRRENEQHLLESYREIVMESRVLDEMKTAFSVLPKPDAGLISEWENILKERENTLIQISALKLRVSLFSKAAVSALIQEGLNPEQSLQLEKEVKWETEASGSFRLQYEGLELTVENGELDMNALTEKLESLQQKESEVKSRLGYETPEAARQVIRHREEKRLGTEQKESLLTRLLRKRSLEQWETWHAEYQQLPPTRSSDVLANELLEKRRVLNQNDPLLRTKEQNIGALESAYGDFEKLTDFIITVKGEIAAITSSLATLPVLPPGYDNIHLYLRELEERKERNRNSESQERELKEKIIRLSAALPEDNPEELEADFLLKERNFLRQKERSHVLLRIQKTLEKVLAEREEADPQKILASKVSERFRRLSCESYQQVRLGEDMEAEGKTALPFQTLSRGTLGSLALALRLSLGELYLEGMRGIVVLDDPFTDMDEKRRSAAARELKAFSEKHQVLLITCHASHTGELLVAGGNQVAITELP